MKTRVANRNDLNDGEMKSVTVGDREVLLARVEGRYHALHAHCTHYGAPLAEGILNGDRVMCPWHHACFSVQTGALLEPPALDAQPRFEVTEEDGEVFVTVPEDAPEKRVPDMASPNTEEDPRTFVILGTGAAGFAAAEALRREGFQGRVVMVSQEDALPYDRTLLSKDYLAEEKTMGWIPAREGSFYQTHAIDLMLGRHVTRLEPSAKKLTFADGDTLSYDALLLASGSKPRTLDVPGSTLSGVFTLRSLRDSERIISQLDEGSRVVVVGSSFIGMECASSARARGAEVTVVARSKPFASLFGEDVATMLQKLHEENGVVFRKGAQVERLEGESQVEGVVLDTGERLYADTVIIGIGVEPATDFLEGVPKNDDGGVSVDAAMHVMGGDGLHAAGDLAAFNYRGERVRIEHWRVAMQGGVAAARAMLGQDVSFDGVPLFWSKQHGVGLRYVGHAEDWDDVVIDGDLDAREFLAYYVKGNEIKAVLGFQRDAELCAVEECLRLDVMPQSSAVREGFSWQEHLKARA